MKHFDSDRKMLYNLTGKMKFILNVSTSPEDFLQTLHVGEELSNTYISLGVHPHDAGMVSKGYLDVIKNIINRERKVLSIGEIGLDYYRNLSPIDTQKKVFAEQLALANELKMPVILHIRDAYKDTYEIVKSLGIERGGIVHAFSSDEIWAKKFSKLGLKLGIGGPLTYPKNDLIRNVVKIVGLENIVTETDCPYLPPQQYRGKRNEPMYVYFVVKELANIFNTTIDKVCNKVWENVNSIFSIHNIAEQVFGAGEND